MSTTKKRSPRPHTPRKLPLTPRPRARTLPPRSPKRHTHTTTYPVNYPLTIRGRVEIALFTCPREGCGCLIRYRARTQIAYRCPECSTTFYVGLRVMIRSRRGGPTGVPHDSVLPKWAPTHKNAQQGAKSSDGDTIATSTSPRPGPRPSPTTRRDDAKDAIPVRLELAGYAEGEIETVPVVVLERWEPGEPLHEVVELVGDDDAFEPEL